MIWVDDPDGILEVTTGAIEWKTVIDSRVMALATFNGPVASYQRKARQTVLKLRLTPMGLKVALTTLRQGSIVRILLGMTVQAGSPVQGPRRTVTVFAGERHMHTMQLQVLMKVADSLPPTFTVTTGAV